MGAHHPPQPDPALTAGRGLRVLAWSFALLGATALLQVLVAAAAGSAALLADAVHNFADAATALPLWIAFWIARRGGSRRFPYGLGRLEDLAGLVIVLAILASGLFAAWESADRLLHPRPVRFLWAVALAAALGFAGNEAVALMRLRVGRQIGSAALVADGYHARADGLVSLAVLVGAGGVWMGYPLADPLVGLGISAMIFWLAWAPARAVFLRLLDGVEDHTLEAIVATSRGVAGVEAVTDVRARWLGHRLHAELSVVVSRSLSVEEGHEIAKEVRHDLLHQVPHLGAVTVHVDPAGEAGEAHHRIGAHAHDGLPAHFHH
jgi:cation diffusion facilitator family transporter